MKPETKNEEINNLELKEKKEFQIEFKNIIYDIILSKTMNNENSLAIFNAYYFALSSFTEDKKHLIISLFNIFNDDKTILS